MLFLLLLFSKAAFTQAINQISSDIDTTEYEEGNLNFNLLIAAEKGYPSEVLRLLNKGADVNTSTDDGATALMYAVQSENLETCKILLYNGANPNITPENLAPALIAAVKNGNLDITELLIRKGANINVQDPEGITSLMYASAFNFFTMADMLIYYNADVNMSDYDGNTALIIASYYGNTDIVSLLIKSQSAIEIPDKKGFRALHCASQNGNLDIVDTLVSKGADIDLKNSLGYSSLSIAVLTSNTRLTNYFIDKGADVNSRISFSLRPLNIALQNKNDTIIELLKNKGGRMNKLPSFNSASLIFKLSTNPEDVMLGGGLGILDTRYGIAVNTGYVARLSAKQVLIKESENIYYQYWEKRSYIFLELTARPSIISWQKKYSFGIGAGGEGLYSFAKYRGTDDKPGNKFIVAPEVFANLRLDNFSISVGYEYQDFKIIDYSPNRLNFYLNLIIPGHLFKKSTKKVLWYI